MEKRSIAFIKWLVKNEATLYLKDYKVNGFSFGDNDAENVLSIMFKRKSSADKGHEVFKKCLSTKEFNEGENKLEISRKGNLFTITIK